MNRIGDRRSPLKNITKRIPNKKIFNELSTLPEPNPHLTSDYSQVTTNETCFQNRNGMSCLIFILQINQNI